MKRLILFLCIASSAFSQSAGVGSIWTTVTGTLQSAAVGNAFGTALAVGGLSSAILTVNCSVTCGGGTTINFEGSQDTTNFVAVNAVQLGTATIAATILNQSTTITAWQIPIGGLQSIRARISAYSAGTITVTATATAAPYDPKTLNSNTFLGGTLADGNSGSKSAQTQRVVLATDQPALTNKLLVTPDSVALPANQSVNAAQLAGTTTDTNSGTKSAGTLRVVLATDQPQLTAKLLVTPDSVALPANQSVNAAQINGVTPLMGNGATGTGAMRVSIASDSTGVVQPGNTANTTPWLNAPAAEATTTNSALTSYTASAASTNSTSLKGSAGNLYGISAINTTATLYYLRLYNSSSAPTCSSATGYVETIPIPASATGAGLERWPHVPQGFTTGIGFCLTGGASSTDNTNAATGVHLTLLYK